MKLDNSDTKKMEVVLNRFLKKYDWFRKIEIENIGYSPSPRVSHFAPVGTIYVDGDWLYEKWREYHYEGPFPDLYDEELGISFGDFIGGELSQKLRGDFITIFAAVTSYLRPKYISWSWISVRSVESEDEHDVNIKENINRIKQVMGIITEIELPTSFRRRLNFSEDYVTHLIKGFILRVYQPNKKNVTISKSLQRTAEEVLVGAIKGSNISYDDILNSDAVKVVKKELKDRFETFANEYYDSMFNGTDDTNTYIFQKHADRHGGNGFAASEVGWHNFLKEYGRWFPDLDWNDIKAQLNSDTHKGKLLIKKPNDEHNVYNYYFSVWKS
jgi:hypothetical protein